MSYAEGEHSARWQPYGCWQLSPLAAKLTKMNPTISDSFASRRLKTSTQMVAGITVSIVDIVSDTYGGNEFLTFKTSEFGESEGLAVSCLTKGRQGNYVNDDGTIAESKTMQYPKGTAVDAYKQVLKDVNELPESQRTYGVLAERLRPVFNGKKIAISGHNYVDRYGNERCLRDFNFA